LGIDEERGDHREQEFFSNGIIPEGFNDNVIVLIPKGTNQKNLADQTD
jgi:hypothetical protein